MTTADPATRPRRPAKGSTTIRAVRVDDALWRAAQDAAAGRDETVSDVIRKALQRYVRASRAGA